MAEKEIIKKLSGLHKYGSTDPEILCSATFHEFNLEQPGADQYQKLQADLFQICRERGDAWTK